MARSTNLHPLGLAALLLLAACSGGGGGTGTAGPGPLPPTPTPPTGPATAVHAGLVALCAGDGAVRVDWDLPEGNFEAALFHGATSTNLVTGTPALSGLTGTSAIVTGLTNGVLRYFTLAVRATGTATWNQVGTVLRTHPNAPIYVDVAAAAGGNGASPTTAFNTLQAGLAAAATRTAANVWVRDGSYGPARFVVAPGVHVFGGFPTGSAFALASRAPLGESTLLTSPALQSTIDVSQIGEHVVLDGLCLDGQRIGFIGVDQDSVDLDLRAVTVRNYVDRGVRLRNTSNEPSVVAIVSCNINKNGNDGVSLVGPYTLRLDGSRFDSNAQEGVDCGTLTALSGSTSTLTATDCRFFGNGAEGLDASLSQPPLTNIGSGRFNVLIRGCRFEANALDGLLIDQEHELAPGWYAHIVVRDCEASNNVGCGVHIDADAAGDYLVHRVRATANQKDGLWVSSETHAGQVIASACELRGNLQAGIRASLGNKSVLASHCVLAGNLQAGFVSSFTESAATNCILHLQPQPFTGVRVLGTPTVTDAASTVFVNSPVAYAAALTHSTGTLGLDRTATFGSGTTVELADNGAALNAASVSGTSVVLGATPTILRLPAALHAFAGASVTEDLHLAAGAVVTGAGMAAAGAAAVDPGIWGSPRAGAPGTADPVDAALVTIEQITPPIATRPTNTQPVVLQFSHVLATASITADRVRVVNGNGTAIAAGIAPAGNAITLNPPAGGWGTQPLRIELHRGITAADGTPFVAPTIIPLNPR